MQAIKFTRALEEISRQLKAQELIEFLRPYMRPEGANAPVTPQDRTRFAKLLFESSAGFTELSRNEETRSLLEAFQLVEVYDSGRLSNFIEILASVPATHNLIANLDIYKIFLSFFDSLSSIVNFAAVSAKFLVADKVHPPTEGDEVLELLILDYDGTGVLAERLQQSLTSLIELHTHLSRILGVTDSVLKITYTDSGSDLALGLAAAAVVIGALRLLFNEYWEKVKFRQFSESDRGMQSLEKSLTIIQKLHERVEAKSLSEEEANVLKQRLLSRMEKLIGNGTMIPSDSTVNVMPDERKLLTYMRDTKLLGTGGGETSPPGSEPEKKEKDDTSATKN
jgi:hypothetical protein